MNKNVKKIALAALLSGATLYSANYNVDANVTDITNNQSIELNDQNSKLNRNSSDCSGNLSCYSWGNNVRHRGGVIKLTYRNLDLGAFLGSMPSSKDDLNAFIYPETFIPGQTLLDPNKIHPVTIESYETRGLRPPTADIEFSIPHHEKLRDDVTYYLHLHYQGLGGRETPPLSYINYPFSFGESSHNYKGMVGSEIDTHFEKTSVVNHTSDLRLFKDAEMNEISPYAKLNNCPNYGSDERLYECKLEILEYSDKVEDIFIGYYKGDDKVLVTRDTLETKRLSISGDERFDIVIPKTEYDQKRNYRLAVDTGMLEYSDGLLDVNIEQDGNIISLADFVKVDPNTRASSNMTYLDVPINGFRKGEATITFKMKDENYKNGEEVIHQVKVYVHEANQEITELGNVEGYVGQTVHKDLDGSGLMVLDPKTKMPINDLELISNNGKNDLKIKNYSKKTIDFILGYWAPQSDFYQKQVVYYRGSVTPRKLAINTQDNMNIYIPDNTNELEQTLQANIDFGALAKDADLVKIDSSNEYIVESLGLVEKTTRVSNDYNYDLNLKAKRSGQVTLTITLEDAVNQQSTTKEVTINVYKNKKVDLLGYVGKIAENSHLQDIALGTDLIAIDRDGNKLNDVQVVYEDNAYQVKYVGTKPSKQYYAIAIVENNVNHVIQHGMIEARRLHIDKVNDLTYIIPQGKDSIDTTFDVRAEFGLLSNDQTLHERVEMQPWNCLGLDLENRNQERESDNHVSTFRVRADQTCKAKVTLSLSDARYSNEDVKMEFNLNVIKYEPKDYTGYVGKTVGNIVAPSNQNLQIFEADKKTANKHLSLVNNGSDYSIKIDSFAKSNHEYVIGYMQDGELQVVTYGKVDTRKLEIEQINPVNIIVPRDKESHSQTINVKADFGMLDENATLEYEVTGNKCISIEKAPTTRVDNRKDNKFVISADTTCASEITFTLTDPNFSEEPIKQVVKVNALKYEAKNYVGYVESTIDTLPVLPNIRLHVLEADAKTPHKNLSLKDNKQGGYDFIIDKFADESLDYVIGYYETSDSDLSIIRYGKVDTRKLEIFDVNDVNIIVPEGKREASQNIKVTADFGMLNTETAQIEVELSDEARECIEVNSLTTRAAIVRNREFVVTGKKTCVTSFDLVLKDGDVEARKTVNVKVNKNESVNYTGYVGDTFGPYIPKGLAVNLNIYYKNSTKVHDKLKLVDAGRHFYKIQLAEYSEKVEDYAVGHFMGNDFVSVMYGQVDIRQLEIKANERMDINIGENDLVNDKILSLHLNHGMMKKGDGFTYSLRQNGRPVHKNEFVEVSEQLTRVANDSDLNLNVKGLKEGQTTLYLSLFDRHKRQHVTKEVEIHVHRKVKDIGVISGYEGEFIAKHVLTPEYAKGKDLAIFDLNGNKINDLEIVLDYAGNIDFKINKYSEKDVPFIIGYEEDNRIIEVFKGRYEANKLAINVAKEVEMTIAKGKTSVAKDLVVKLDHGLNNKGEGFNFYIKENNGVVKAINKTRAVNHKEHTINLTGLKKGNATLVLELKEANGRTNTVRKEVKIKVNQETISNAQAACSVTKRDANKNITYIRQCYRTGKVERETFYTYRGKTLVKTVNKEFAFKTNGRLVKQTVYENYKGGKWTKRTITHRHDNKGNKVYSSRVLNRYTNGKTKNFTYKIYHNNGRLKLHKYTTYNTRGKSTYHFNKEYFKTGVLRFSRVYSKYVNGQHTRRVFVRYNQNKVIMSKEIVTFNKRGQFTSKVTYRYNKQGKLRGGKGNKAWRVKIFYKNGKAIRSERKDYNKRGRLV